jgi:hypothetical protein
VLTGRPRCWFVNVSSGAVAFVKEVGSYHAQLQIVTREGSTSTYAMPLVEYDSNFVKAWRPATVEDLRIHEGQTFRLPLNAPPDWQDEEEPAPVV